VRETDASGTTDYLFGPGIDEPLAMARNGSVSFFAVDGLGSVALVMTPSGTVQDAYLYDAWGEIRSQSRTLPEDFGYTGREFGEEGLWFFRARYYQPGIARFIAEDPIGELFGRVGSPGSYLYGDNDPVTIVDPLGLESVHRASVCGSRFISFAGGANHTHNRFGRWADRKFGNNLPGVLRTLQGP
jgi:RHS repeat-associated protein